MDFAPTDIQTMVRDTARKFAREEVAPFAAEMDKSAEFRMDLVRQMGELGFMEVYNMLGGINQWKAEELPTTK